jgi:hypothetical protein
MKILYEKYLLFFLFISFTAIILMFTTLGVNFNDSETDFNISTTYHTQNESLTIKQEKGQLNLNRNIEMKQILGDGKYSEDLTLKISGEKFNNSEKTRPGRKITIINDRDDKDGDGIKGVENNQSYGLYIDKEEGYAIITQIKIQNNKSENHGIWKKGEG